MAASKKSPTIQDKCKPSIHKSVGVLPYNTCATQIYVVELEGYHVGRKRLYIKEICLLELNGRVCNHRFCKIPPSPPGDDKTLNYVYHHIHGIPYDTALDKQLPRIEAKSLLITHGLEKAGLLQRLYPHCLVVCWQHEKSYDKFKLPTATAAVAVCPLMKHGPACAFIKAHKLRALLLHSF